MKIYEREGMSKKDMILPQFNLLGQYMAKQFFEEDEG
jgi:hypothetical protein